MSMYSSSLYLHECKTQASRLLKAVLSPKKEIQLQAYHRMQILPEFKGKTLADIVEMIQLKHALKLIAKEKKFNSWLDLKTHIVKSNPEDFINLIFNGFLNKWFSSYNQAKEEHFKNKGYWT